MHRRTFLAGSLAAALGRPLLAALEPQRLSQAAALLSTAVGSGQVSAAAMYVAQRDFVFERHFGLARTADARFLLGSITKPICVTALMALFDRGEFRLDDPLQKFLPAFTGEGRETITLRQLLTHVSGLPDQLPANNELRKQHAGLAVFVEQALRTPLSFAPGTQYQYSSMAILLACHLAERLTGRSILDLVNETVLKPLGMQHSVLGLGSLQLSDVVPCQTERAAPESGAGDPSAKDWDWNSPHWRRLGAPWGGLHASAADVARFLDEFLHRRGAVVTPDTADLMTRNHNPPVLPPRGLGFNVSAAAGSPGCSEQTFGHTGSTGTLAWADPATETLCVVLTSLPARALQPHPRDVISTRVAAAAKE